MSAKKAAKKPTDKKPRKTRCNELVSVCRNPGCRFRFDVTDRTKTCVKCGEGRKCERETSPGEKKCFMHGGGGDAMTGLKLVVPAHLAKTYNRILSNPGLMSLAENQAMIEARGDEINRMIEDADSRGSHERILALTFEIRELVQMCEMNNVPVPTATLKGMLAQLIRATEPVAVEWSLWKEQFEVQDMVRRLNDTERRWASQLAQNVPMAEVIEALTVHARLSLKYITDPQDRMNYAREMRSLMPASTR